MGAHRQYLQTPLQMIKGVGSQKAEVLKTAGLFCVEQMLEYYPRRYLDRTSVTRIGDLDESTGECTIVGRVTNCSMKGYSRKQRFEAVIHDGSGQLTLVWFNRVRWIRRALKVGEVVAVSGVPRVYRGWQMQHPELEKLLINEEDLGEFEYEGQVVPIYRGTEELRKAWLDSRALKKIVLQIIQAPELCFPEILPVEFLKARNLVSLDRSMRDVHLAKNLQDVSRARRRLKYQEFFMLELMFALRHTERQLLQGMCLQDQSGLLKKLFELLPFQLTSAQSRVLGEIRQDMASGYPMNRLIQGDVGSGKTIVALAAMLIAVSNQKQAILMAPTEILAEQHFKTLMTWCDPLGIRLTLLTGSRKGELRRKALSEIAGGWAQIVIGTHALFQESVTYCDPGLVVIDEQHRFGVMQRASLKQKGLELDTLVMTATPIPRTMAIVSYGDMNLSIIDKLPPGRKAIRTEWRSESRREKIFIWLKNQLQKGAQAYVVYPLVEESAKLELIRAAEETCLELKEGILKDFSVGLLHGRMKGPEKTAVMQAFHRGEIEVLVSTTVIEVGVDNPNATIMIVDHAERFGLSQLHQLRGRVGRGGKQSWCVLIAGQALSQEGRERLETLARTNDGFEIAEVDMRMRGSGDFFGTRQSGLPLFRIADIIRDQDLLLQARDDAFKLVERDPLLDQHNVLHDWLKAHHGDDMKRAGD